MQRSGIIEKMTESVSNLEECTTLILACPKAGTTKFIAFGLKQFNPSQKGGYSTKVE